MVSSKFIYLFLAALGLLCPRGLFSVAAADATLRCIFGCSLQGLLLFELLALGVSVSSCGMWALEHKLSSCGAWASLLLRRVGVFPGRDGTPVPCLDRWIPNHWTTLKSCCCFFVCFLIILDLQKFFKNSRQKNPYTRHTRLPPKLMY